MHLAEIPHTENMENRERTQKMAENCPEVIQDINPWDSEDQ